MKNLKAAVTMEHSSGGYLLGGEINNNRWKLASLQLKLQKMAVVYVLKFAALS
jgi:hypothetical protein